MCAKTSGYSRARRTRGAHGERIRAPGSHRLEQLTDMHPEAADQIEAIQKRVLEACGPRDTSAKRSIIQALRRR